ncbi:energy transducer TonB family protein [Pannonibacter indicus]|jgi:protein TonB|uniref:TonB family C-terminal domain n=1 Tax=Pannonibacter indicus TaxID=466044 RepID=A0A0K6HY34_9HYPH|nr:energy transducer TonB [Pannonibacter indicus]CUA95824.1 TonB family C-terminal domain [Pannonibacter indicus]
MKLRPWHLGAALLASVTLHFGAIALTVDTSEEPALLQGGGGAVSMLGEAYTDMLTSGDPDTANAVAAESPDTLAPVDPDAAEPETQEHITAQDIPVQEATETPVQEPLQQMAEVQPQDIKPQEIAPVEELAIQPLTSAEAIAPINETPEETVTAIEPVPVPEMRPKDLPVKVAEAAKPVQPVKRTQTKKPEAQRQPSTQKGNSRANAVQGAGGAADQVASQGSSENQGQSTILGNSDRTNYKGQVQRALQRAMRRVRSREAGLATVSFVVSKDGSVSAIRISSSSGNPEVDEVALELVRRAAPFPPIPAEEGRSTWNFNVPVEITRR